MPAYARRQIVDESVVGVYHCMARCVRRAFLCGVDQYSGRNFDHRKVWVRQRLEELAGIVAVDILGFAVLVTHLGRRFHRAIGSVPSLAARAASSGKRWLHSVLASRLAFSYRETLQSAVQRASGRSLCALWARPAVPAV